MALEGTQPPSQADSGSVYGEFYYAHYSHDEDTPYERSDEWLAMFGAVADAIVRELAPVRVLDVGCAMGFLVEQLRARGVEAWGTDVSSYAISQVHPSVAPYCAVSSVLDPLPEGFPTEFDLVTCVEVIEHLKPDDVGAALTNLCSWGDRILYSSSPDDFVEPTHLALQPSEQWSASFATRGFLRNFDINADFLAPWAVVYDRLPFSPSDVVARYERRLTRQAREIVALRGQLLKTHEQMAGAPGTAPAPREVVSTLEGEIATLRGHIEVVEAEINSLGRALAEKDATIEAQRTTFDAELAELATELERLRDLVGADETSYEQLRLNVWSVRDHAIAQEAIALQARAQAAEARAAEQGARFRADHLSHAIVEVTAMYENVRDHRDALLESFTWRVGHTVMAPVRRTKRSLGRPV